MRRTSWAICSAASGILSRPPRVRSLQDRRQTRQAAATPSGVAPLLAPPRAGRAQALTPAWRRSRTLACRERRRLSWTGSSASRPSTSRTSPSARPTRGTRPRRGPFRRGCRRRAATGRSALPGGSRTDPTSRPRSGTSSRPSRRRQPQALLMLPASSRRTTRPQRPQGSPRTPRLSLPPWARPRPCRRRCMVARPSSSTAAPPPTPARPAFRPPSCRSRPRPRRHRRSRRFRCRRRRLSRRGPL
mmetsp:Transcript_171194/g.548801  ORF Transcript_171194/g.548801 Transcript_171194/m.548801 type:complete len:245 (+) Transcript_171194:425-1159(+)